MTTPTPTEGSLGANTPTHQHTPGPWRIKGRTHLSGEFIRVESVHPSKHLYQVADVIAANGYPENEANARLIATAPEMLEVLDWLVQILPDPELDNDELQRTWTKRAREIIAKVRWSAS